MPACTISALFARRPGRLLRLMTRAGPGSAASLKEAGMIDRYRHKPSLPGGRAVRTQASREGLPWALFTRLATRA